MFHWLADATAGAHIRDTRLLIVAGAVWLTCCLWLWISASRHRRNIRAVPIRIHVAGTRGKSTVTRMIAAGMRAADMRVLAKATGSAPRLILSDGSEEIWARRGLASIREQIRLFRRAVGLKADALVVECMAIQPEMIWASETHLIQATTTVITNARPDHFEELGEEPGAMADALRWVVPTNGHLVVSDEAFTDALRKSAVARNCKLTIVSITGLDPHEANRAIAMAVCETHAIDATVAGPAIEAATPDPGHFFETRLTIGGKAIRFANAFSSNDVDSLAIRWNEIATSEAPVVLFNARPDRPLRTQHFMAYLASLPVRPKLFVTGDPLSFHLARRAGFSESDVRRLNATSATAALAELAGAAANDGMIWGIGNFYGLGLGLTAELEKHVPAC